MDFRRLFNIPVALPQRRYGPTPAGKSTATPAKDGSIGSFVTPQTIASFPGATGVIILLWKLVDTLKPTQEDHEIYVGGVVSLLVGAFLYYMNVSDPKAPTTDLRGKIIAAVIALINTAVLLGAAKSVVMKG